MSVSGAEPAGAGWPPPPQAPCLVLSLEGVLEGRKYRSRGIFGDHLPELRVQGCPAGCTLHSPPRLCPDLSASRVKWGCVCLLTRGTDIRSVRSEAHAALGDLRQRPICVCEEQKLGQEALTPEPAGVSQGIWPSWQGASLVRCLQKVTGVWAPCTIWSLPCPPSKWVQLPADSPFSEPGKARAPA